MKPFLHISRLFQVSFIFGEASPSNFLRVTVLRQESLFWSSYFFSVVAFLKSSVFERFISLNQSFFAAYLIFRSETSTEQSFLENRNYFSGLPRLKISLKELPCRSRYCYTGSAFLEELHLRKSFRAASSSKDTTCYIRATFSELLSNNILFQKSCYFTAKLLLHSYT